MEPSGRSPICHIRFFNPVDEGYGMSPIQAAAQQVHLFNGCSTCNCNLLKNDMQPAGVYIADGTLSREQRDFLREQLKAEHSGPKNILKVLVLEKNGKFTPFSLSPRNIARPETHTSYNQSKQEAGNASGLDLMKDWLSVEAENTCEDHANAYGQRVDRKEFFTGGSNRMFHPGDPDSPA